MHFVWPQMLWVAVLLPPLLVAGYLWMLRRRKREVVRYASLDLVRPALGRGPAIRRHLPPLLFLLGIGIAAFGLARPEARITLPSMHQTIVLAVDVSLSMSATDVDPSRITAAQAAAKSFVEALPSNVRVALVAFGGNAIVVQQPTSNRDELVAAIGRFELQRGTATGSALYAALHTLMPDAGIDLSALDFKWENVRNPRDSSQYALKQPTMKDVPPVPPGSYDAGAIVLMSDGKSMIGPSPIDAARAVAARGVRVFTVGFGTREGGFVKGDGWSLFVRLDEETLQAIADITKGTYFQASTAEELTKIYRDLNSRLVMERKDVELTAMFAGASAVLLLLAAMLSLWWFGPSRRGA